MLTGEKPPEATARATNDTMEPAAVVGKGRFSAEFLGAIDWALKVKPEERPQDVQQFATALFAAHASALGLTEALAAGEDKVAEKETWLQTLKSPRLMRRRLNRFGDLLFRPSSWPMGVKMTLAMVATALLPMIITAYYNVNGSIDSISKTELKNSSRLRRASLRGSRSLSTTPTSLRCFLAPTGTLSGIWKSPTTRRRRKSAASSPTCRSPIPTCSWSWCSTPRHARIATDPTITGRNFKFREYFKANMEGKPFVTSPDCRAATGAYGVFFAQPVRNKDDAVIGAVVMRYSSLPFEKMLSDARAGTRVAHWSMTTACWFITLIRRYASRAWRPCRKKPSTKSRPNQRFRRNTIESVNMPDVNKALLAAKEPGNISYVSTISKKEEIAGFAPVKGHEWVVAVSETRDEFSAPLDRIFSNVLYSVFLVGMVFLLLAMLFARSIVSPIQELQTAALALKSGDYDKASVRVRSNDEIGQLGRTFNVMIDVLRAARARTCRQRAGRPRRVPVVGLARSKKGLRPLFYCPRFIVC